MKRQIVLLTVIILTGFFSKTSAQCIANAGNDTTLCVCFGPDTITLGGSPTVTSGTAPFTYKWTCNYSYLNLFFYTASDYLDDTTSANPRLIYLNDDTLAFYLTVTDSLGNSCSDTVVVRFCGTYAWTADWKYAVISPGGRVQILPSVGNGCPPLSFQWFPNYNISDPNIANPYVWPDTSTHYYSIVTDAGGCQANGGIFDVFVNTVGIDEQEENLTPVKIFPNPLTGISLINIDLNDALIIFYDMYGRATYQVVVNQSVEIKRADFKAGLYLYRVIHHNRIAGQGKLVVK